jgi:hypothetical protein
LGITPNPRYYEPIRSRTPTGPVIDSRPRFWSRPKYVRLSQDPRLVCRRAQSLLTPGWPDGCTCLLLRRPLWASASPGDWPPPTSSVTRPVGSLTLQLTPSPRGPEYPRDYMSSRQLHGKLLSSCRTSQDCPGDRRTTAKRTPLVRLSSYSAILARSWRSSPLQWTPHGTTPQETTSNETLWLSPSSHSVALRAFSVVRAVAVNGERQHTIASTDATCLVTPLTRYSPP